MRTQLRGKKKHNYKPIFKILIVLPVLLLFIALLLIIKNRPDKIILASFNKDEGVAINIYNFAESKKYTLKISSDLQADASHQLGTWPIYNIWQLGENEGIGGNKLLSSSLSKTFNIPISKTNMNLKDRIYLYYFNVIYGRNKENREVNDVQMPISILSLFSDKYLVSNNFKVEIINQSGSNQEALELSKVIETLGLKVLTIKKGQIDNSDCFVVTKDFKAGRILSENLNCKYVNSKPSANFDIDVNIGELFYKRY